MALVLQAVGWPSVGLVKTSVGIWVTNTTSHPSPGVLKPNISQPQAVQVCHPPPVLTAAFPLACPKSWLTALSCTSETQDSSVTRFRIRLFFN